MFGNHLEYLIEIKETDRNAIAISLVSGAKHRANGDASIFHVKETTSLFLPTDSRERSSNGKKKRREKEGKNDVYGREATVSRSTSSPDRGNWLVEFGQEIKRVTCS